MGLDIDIERFDREFFEKHEEHYGDDKPGQGHVDYHTGSGNEQQLFYYRKHYVIRDTLVGLCNGMDQCTYHRLTREMLEESRRIAQAAIPTLVDDDPDKKHYLRWLEDVEKILTETDFEHQVIALSWVS